MKTHQGCAAHADNRINTITYVHETFCKVLDIETRELSDDFANDVDKYISEEVVKIKIRETLDIEDLVRVRKGLINEACPYINT